MTSPESRMVAEYEITKNDWIALNLYHEDHSPLARRRFYLGLFLPPAVWLGFFGVSWYFADRDRDIPLQMSPERWILLLFVPLYLFVFLHGCRQGPRRESKGRVLDKVLFKGKNKSMFGWRRVSLTDRTFIEESEFGNLSRSWEGVEKVAATDDYLYIYLSAVSAIFVPRRAFSDPSDFDRFVAAAVEYHRQNQPGG